MTFLNAMNIMRYEIFVVCHFIHDLDINFISIHSFFDCFNALILIGKQRRLKQAKEEAQEEIEKYRQERERQFKEFEAKVFFFFRIFIPNWASFINFFVLFSTWVRRKVSQPKSMPIPVFELKK